MRAIKIDIQERKEKMRLSEILHDYPDENVVEIINEKDFSRFSVTTAVSSECCCVFVDLKRYIKTIPQAATMVITTPEIAKGLDSKEYGICISENPKITYFRAFRGTAASMVKPDFPTEIDSTARIGKYVNISGNNVKIGKNVTIEDFVTISDNVYVGDNVVVRAGAKLGIEDYNYYEDNERLVHIKHYGNLIIESAAEIGYNSVIGKALYPNDSTIIGEGTQIAGACLIGHDCKLDKSVMVYAGTVVGGFCTIGKGSQLKMGSTIKNRITIGKNAQIGMGAAVVYDVSDGETVFGNPAKRMIVPKL